MNRIIHSSLTSLIAVIITSLSIQSAQAQVTRWNGNGHYYQPVLVLNGLTWAEANNAATAAGGHLVTVTSAAEDSFVYSLFSSIPQMFTVPSNPSFGNSLGPWMGGYLSGSSYKWVTGEDFYGYTHFTPGEPNNAGGNEDRLQYVAGGTWNDVPNAPSNYYIGGYIVEYETEPITPPLLFNGSFELTNLDSTNALVQAGQTGIRGWNVTRNNVDLAGTLWQAANGTRSVDLDGYLIDGAISTSFITVPGQTYQMRFSMAGNPDGGPALKTFNMSVDGSNQSSLFSFDTTGKSKQNMGWAERVFTFTATGSVTTMSLSSLTGTGFGAAVDNFRLVVVPESSTIFLLGFAAPSVVFAFVYRLRIVKVQRG